jgi:L-asparaginase / beta-aspartyl-peptidase
MSLHSPIALVLHGGAGTLTRNTFSLHEEALTCAALERSLSRGEQVLRRNGSAHEAVVASIIELENDPLFNAGYGSVFTAQGNHELDAALMQGHTRSAGAVCGLSTVKNPIRLAEAVLLHSNHVLLAGPGAERFADERSDIERVPNSYFSTQERRAQLEQAQSHEQIHGKGGYFGTVGAVALDRYGHLAAGTSTGGLSNKRYGRVGDSPILGAGTYASELVGISATGTGEYFIRTVAAHALDSRVRYLKQDLNEAAKALILGEIRDLGGDGGLIALDREGNIAMPCNISSMARAALHPNGSREVAVFMG